MTRLLLLLAGALALPAFAQPAKVYRIGMLETTSAIANRGNLNAFLQGLREAGWVEGRNIVIDYRSADGRPERFPELAAELMRAKADIIVTRGSDAALAARNAGSVPVVMVTSADPVAAGVVKSLANPGGNVTGLTTLAGEVPVKRIQALKELVPRVSRIAAMLNLSHATANVERRQIERACKSLGVEAIILDVRDPEGLERALEVARQQRADALLINSEAVLMANRKAIVDFARKHSLPAMYSAREYIEAGGLAAYGVSYRHLYHRAASYADKILRGAKPGDLPIGKPTKLNLIINVRATTALGLAIPSELLLRAEKI
jgi:putative tryptophan/tyrosine transport system substrate-binding protein